MTDVATEFAAIRSVHPSASLHSEGGTSVVLLPDAKFVAGGQSVVMSLLLFPSAHSGYVTRLFFERRLEGAGKSQNWTEHTVLSRRWWAPSWQNVPPELPWRSILCAHLRAVA